MQQMTKQMGITSVINFATVIYVQHVLCSDTDSKDETLLASKGAHTVELSPTR